MPFMDVFRNFFGINNNTRQDPNSRSENPRGENHFRKPIWENEDDDDDYNSDFRHPQGGGVHFEIFEDSLEVPHNFETQIDYIMKHFFGGFPWQGRGFITEFDNDPTEHFALPAPSDYEDPSIKSFRDHFLKREFDSINHSQNLVKEDTDLDGKVSSEDLVKAWQNPRNQQIESVKPGNYFSGVSTSTKIINRGDGSVEKHQTFKDSNGNEKTVVRRQIGDKVHEFITKKDKDGVESTTQNFININENDINAFDNNWKSVVQNPQPNYNERNDFPWHKLFGPDPKL